MISSQRPLSVDHEAGRSPSYFTAKSLYMFRVSPQPSSGLPKTVTAASGTGHNIGAATSQQRGQKASGTGHNIGTATSQQRGQKASGTGHNIGTATSQQRGQKASVTGHNIGTATSLQRGTFQGSSCTDIMTCARG